MIAWLYENYLYENETKLNLKRSVIQEIFQ